MREHLTKPTRGQLALWLALALMWFLFLPQELAMDPGHEHFSWVGAAFWAVVLVSLLAMAIETFRRRRRARAARPKGGPAS